MTTIRISRLPEIRNDRVTPDDYLIINDGDIVTSKVKFSEFVYAIGGTDIEITGDWLYTGDVVFEGDVTGDFYNKDQTYSKAEIDQIIRDLNDYNILQDARINALIDLSGMPPLSEHLGIFPGTVYPSNSTIRECFEVTEQWLTENRLRIEQNEIDIIQLKQDIVDINDKLTQIDIILDGLGGGTPPGPTPPDPDAGLIDKVNWLIGQVNDHEARIVALEGLCGATDISLIADGTLTGIAADHETRIVDLESRAAINDAENANLITLSGVSKSGGNIGGVAIVSDNLENFTYALVPHAIYNQAIADASVNGKNNKEAFQIHIDAINTRAPIESPVFTEQIRSGQKYGITGPPVSPSMIPMYHQDVTNLRGYKHASDDTTDSCEGAFAYTRTNTGYTGIGGSNSSSVQGRAWVRNQTEWLELVTTANRSSLWAALGLFVAPNDADAAAKFQALGFGPISSGQSGSGYIYVQKDNPLDPDEEGYLKVLGVNTASNPRA